ncbi:hypothetical protein ACLMJK_006266 [Lecanora helva]
MSQPVPTPAAFAEWLQNLHDVLPILSRLDDNTRADLEDQLPAAIQHLRELNAMYTALEASVGLEPGTLVQLYDPEEIRQVLLAQGEGVVAGGGAGAGEEDEGEGAGEELVGLETIEEEDEEDDEEDEDEGEEHLEAEYYRKFKNDDDDDDYGPAVPVDMSKRQDNLFNMF